MQSLLRRTAGSSLLVVLGFVAASCQAAPGQAHNHWNIESLKPRISKTLLGYEEDSDGSYREFQWRQKQDINLTLRRHFLNSNPENPFQADDPNIHAPRPPHSLLPDPVDYFHLESLSTGLITLLATGAFIPVPIGSVLGTLEEGGGREFAQGFSGSLSGSYTSTLGSPPEVKKFRVRHPEGFGR
jgi:hypothetical protein